MLTEERIHLLQAMPFFGAINNSSVELILGLSTTVKMQAGEVFFKQGDNGDALFLLEEGSVSIYKEFEQQEHTLRHVHQGDCFGDLALIDFTCRSASVRADTDCIAIKIPAAALHSLYQQDPEQFLLIQMNMAREVSRRLRTADERWFQQQRSGDSSRPANSKTTALK